MTGPKKDSHHTIFDRILRHEIPAKIVYEDDHVLAFHDISPQAPIHVLVIPKHRVERFSQVKDLDVTMVGEFFIRVSQIATKLGVTEEGFRLVINNGANGQQSVEYLHAHILGGRPLTGQLG